MSAQRFYQLLVAFVTIAAIALASERSHVLASFVSVIPVNITMAIWFLFSSTGGDTAVVADYARMALLGLLPVLLFTLTCWLCLRQGWQLRRVFVSGYAVWITATILYRAVELWWKTTSGH